MPSGLAAEGRRMRVVGIDPGIATTGYAVVERTGGGVTAHAVGVVRTSSDAPQGARLAELRTALARVFSAHRPEVAAVERLFFNANVKTAMAVGQASGVALLGAAEAGIDVVDYTPLEVKHAVVGFGGATKQQVAAMVGRLLGFERPPRPPDAADACALALCHLNRAGLARAVAAARP
jgi:crossover junction endodeoxyribonuclease RuvC